MPPLLSLDGFDSAVQDEVLRQPTLPSLVLLLPPNRSFLVLLPNRLAMVMVCVRCAVTADAVNKANIMHVDARRTMTATGDDERVTILFREGMVRLQLRFFTKQQLLLLLLRD